MRAASSPVLIALFALLLGGCNLAFPLDEYGSGAAGAGSGSGSGGVNGTPHLYVFGGISGGKTTSTVLAAPIEKDGSLGAFVAEGPMAIPLSRYASAAMGGRFYAIGGQDAAATITEKAEMGALDGAGHWIWSPLPSITFALQGSSAVVYGNRLFLFGGHAGMASYSSAIQTADLTTDGSFSGWTTSMVKLPLVVGFHTTLVDDAGHLYLISGSDPGGAFLEVWMTTLDPSGAIGAWVQQPPYAVARFGHCSVFWGGHIYLVGGQEPGKTFADIQRAELDATGKIKAWTTLPQKLPVALTGLGCAAFNDRMYVVGGANETMAYADVYYASFQPNGDLGPWTTAPSLPSTTGHMSILVR